MSRFSQPWMDVHRLGITLASGDGILDRSAGIGQRSINDGQIQLLDFSLARQTVSGIATTEIDYELGSYVILNLTADIAALTFINPPSNQRVGSMRIRIVQDSTPRTIAWPASVKWPGGGGVPLLSTGSGAIDFVDLWTDNAGTVWYGIFNSDWS